MSTRKERHSRPVPARAILDRRIPDSALARTAASGELISGLDGRPRIPRRAVAALAGTALGLALLFSFKTPETLMAAGSAAQTTRTTSSTPTGSDSSRSTATSVAGAPSANPQTVSATKAITGSVVSSPYGDVQVQITVANGSITAINAVRLPSDNRHSSQISGFASQVLASEALQAQSANIDTVSGATYTSDAYKQSLQSALDQAAAA
jgi:uncharacterized protein with FMN-binding domain